MDLKKTATISLMTLLAACTPSRTPYQMATDRISSVLSAQVPENGTRQFDVASGPDKYHVSSKESTPSGRPSEYSIRILPGPDGCDGVLIQYKIPTGNPDTVETNNLKIFKERHSDLSTFEVPQYLNNSAPCNMSQVKTTQERANEFKTTVQKISDLTINGDQYVRR